jgi:predicted anti-sigma-YlaC factor YlaD
MLRETTSALSNAMLRGESQAFVAVGKGTKGVPTCRDMSELVTDYLERALSIRKRLDMWWHLARCEACRHYYDQMRRTIGLLRRIPPTRPDTTTEDGVVAAARRQRGHD